MGALLTRPQCDNLGVASNCNITTDQNGNYTSIGGLTKGEIPADPDIAGIGIVAAFLAVSCFAMLVSTLDIAWQMSKLFCLKKKKKRESGRGLLWRSKRAGISFPDICENLVLSCSDQQIFTGAAYAVTLRYYGGCTISAYHYNVVANMLLLTCTTHLMSVMIVREYWKYPFLAVLRLIVVTGAFWATGVFLANQNHSGKLFPTEVPPAGTSNGPILLPAICFGGGASLTATLGDSIEGLTAESHIHGWHNYLAMLGFYGAAIIVEMIRYVRQGQEKQGERAAFMNKFKRGRAFLSRHQVIISTLFAVYMIGGIATSAWTVGTSAQFILAMRRWVKASGWLQLENGRNPEDDATSFGQLVPIFLTSLTIFSFCQIISEKVSERNQRKKEELDDGIGLHPDSPESVIIDEKFKSKVDAEEHQLPPFPWRTDVELALQTVTTSGSGGDKK